MVSALAALGFLLLLPGKLATDADYQSVAEVLTREAEPGDVVFLYPWWTERARLFVPGSLPVIGYLHSEKDDLLENPRIWLLEEPGLPNASAAGSKDAFLTGRVSDGATRRFGHLALTRYRNGRARTLLFSGVNSLAQAHVSVERAGDQRSECTFDGRAFRCPGELRVAAEWHELLYAPWRCLSMAPPGGPDRLVAEWTDVPPAALTLLEGGIIWEHAPRTTGVTPLHVGVEDSGPVRSHATLTVAPGTEGMQQLTVPPSGNASRSLKVWTQSDSREGREACVSLRAFGPSTLGGAP